jgi:hypothetical protein
MPLSPEQRLPFPRNTPPALPTSHRLSGSAAIAFYGAGVLLPRVSSHAHGPLHSECQNCGTPLQGPHCHRCGQRDFDFHRSFGHVVHEAIETWFHFDGSFFRGFYDLLFRPGRMTRDFNEGKRARHVPPFRFYLVLSVVFFFVFSLGTRSADAFALSGTGPKPRYRCKPGSRESICRSANP